MAVRVVIDRRRCIGAGTCIVLAPSAFQWRQGDFVKPELLDPNSVDEDVLREVAAACPTRAIVLEEVLESVDSSHI
jgi:ferredoxin